MRNCTIVVRLIMLAATLMLALIAVGALAVGALLQSDQRLHAGHTRYTLPLVDLGAVLSEVQHARGLLAAGLLKQSRNVPFLQSRNVPFVAVWGRWWKAIARKGCWR